MKNLICTLLLLFSTSLFAQKCDYYTNEVSPFDGTIIKELNYHYLYEEDLKTPNGFVYSRKKMMIKMKRHNNDKFVTFNGGGNVPIGAAKLRVKVKLDNGEIITFNSTEEILSTTYLNLDGRLLPKEEIILLESPIEVIRFEYIDAAPNETKFTDYLIQGVEKYYFTNNIQCLR